jgi:hypothetical protein
MDRVFWVLLLIVSMIPNIAEVQVQTRCQKLCKATSWPLSSVFHIPFSSKVSWSEASDKALVRKVVYADPPFS